MSGSSSTGFFVRRSRLPGFAIIEKRVRVGENPYSLEHFVDRRIYRWIGVVTWLRNR